MFESTLRTLPDFLLPLSSHLISPSLFQHVLYHSISVITLLFFFCLFIGLRGSRTGPALPDWRRNYHHSFSQAEYLCLHHANLTSSPLSSLPSLFPHPSLLHPEWGRPYCSDAHWSSPWHSPTGAGPKLCHRLPGHSLCWATGREAAFSSCWNQAPLDRRIRGHCLPKCLLPVCGHIIPWLPGYWDVEPQQGDEWRLSVPQHLGALLTQTTQSHRHGLDLWWRYLVMTYSEWVQI